MVQQENNYYTVKYKKGILGQNDIIFAITWLYKPQLTREQKCRWYVHSEETHCQVIREILKIHFSILTSCYLTSTHYYSSLLDK
jgi:hypothetical protein